MPHYYFHLFNDEVLRDQSGQQCADLPAARQTALRGIAELIAEHLVAGQPVDLSHRIDVAQADGTVSQSIYFRDLFVNRGEPLQLP